MPKYNFTTKRLFIPSSIEEGKTIQLDRAASNYLLNVLRLKVENILLIFDGENGEWEAKLLSDKKKSAQLLPLKKTREQTPLSKLIYCFAPIKAGRMDYMVQKAVEMGAGEIQPVITQYTNRHKGAQEKELSRIKANAIEAAEQCGILNIPACNEAVKFENWLANWPKAQPLFFCDESAETTNPLKILSSKSKADSLQNFGILIGPEGGFSSFERDLLYNCPFVEAIPLGPRILRADTAAVAAMAVLQATLGDWN